MDRDLAQKLVDSLGDIKDVLQNFAINTNPENARGLTREVENEGSNER